MSDPLPQMEAPPVQFARAGTHRLAFMARAGDGAQPGLVWLGGFKSDMHSTKATRLDAWCAAQGRACLRFDYSGHGQSDGRFADGTIGLWLDDSLAMIRAHTQGPQILVGSSMGGWLALLCARALNAGDEAARLAGLVLIAPAVDFTEALLWPRLPEAARRALMEEGVWMRPSAYAPEPIPITRALIEDGRNHLLLQDTIRSHCPVHILQGMQDPDVPWQHAMRVVHHLAADPVVVTLIRDGDHRLSREDDIARLLNAITGLL